LFASITIYTSVSWITGTRSLSGSKFALVNIGLVIRVGMTNRMV